MKLKAEAEKAEAAEEQKRLADEAAAAKAKADDAQDLNLFWMSGLTAPYKLSDLKEKMGVPIGKTLNMRVACCDNSLSRFAAEIKKYKLKVCFSERIHHTTILF